MQVFFMNTLCIGHTPIDTARKQCGASGTFVGENHCGKNDSNKTNDENAAAVQSHIESFPKIESHYTRSDTKRQYPNQTLNISKMYRLYKESCEANDTPSAKEYCKIFCTEYYITCRFTTLKRIYVQHVRSTNCLWVKTKLLFKKSTINT